MSPQNEAQLAFRKLLSRLNPSSASNERCVDFVASHSEEASLLFDCFLTEMNRSSLNGRVKQLNFLEYCLGIVGHVRASPEWNEAIIDGLQKIVDAAVPSQYAPSALANIGPTHRFIDGVHSAGFIDATLKERMSVQIDSKSRSLKALMASRTNKHQVTKEEVLRRMEDDRERGKKYKEKQLAIKIGSDKEFEAMWQALPPPTTAELNSLKDFNSLANV